MIKVSGKCGRVFVIVSEPTKKCDVCLALCAICVVVLSDLVGFEKMSFSVT